MVVIGTSPQFNYFVISCSCIMQMTMISLKSHIWRSLGEKNNYFMDSISM